MNVDDYNLENVTLMVDGEEIGNINLSEDSLPSEFDFTKEVDMNQFVFPNVFSVEVVGFMKQANGVERSVKVQFDLTSESDALKIFSDSLSQESLGNIEIDGVEITNPLVISIVRVNEVGGN